jgi:hypothetical protein
MPQQGQVIRMAMKQGDAVANSKCLDWGTGVVLSIGATSVEVQFPEVGRKRLLTEVLVPSSRPAPIFDKKGRQVDPDAPKPKKSR